MDFSNLFDENLKKSPHYKKQTFLLFSNFGSEVKNRNLKMGYQQNKVRF